MSYEAWGDGDDMGVPDGYVTEEVAEDKFRAGAWAMREMLARFVENGGDHVTANSIRLNWPPSWGVDPGKLDGEIPSDCWSA